MLKKFKKTAALTASAVMVTTLFSGNILALTASEENGLATAAYDESGYEVQSLDEVEFGEIDFTSDWKFYLSTVKTDFVEETLDAEGKVVNTSIKKGLKDGVEGPSTVEMIQPNFDDSGWRTVDVPHDWGIEFARYRSENGETTAGAGFLPGGVGFYRKTFMVPEELKGKKISVEFDGVYMDSTVYVNGELVGEYPSGYMGFCYDISPYLKYGEENVIAVRCSDKVASSRWYSGRGIYRPVRILVDTDTRFVRNSVYLATPEISETYPKDQSAEMQVTAEIYSVKDISDAKIVTTLYDEKGDVFITGTSEGVSVSANEKQSILQTVHVENPELWDCENPNLYTAVVELFDGDQAVDCYTTPFGFKWFEVSANDGFSLNGEYILLQGVNLHHENGMIGTVSEPDALERKVRIMKEMGVNAIRTAHNPENQEFIDACNKLGVMVLEESADHVTGGKSAYDWGKWFNDEVPVDWAGTPDGGYPEVTLAVDGEYKEAPYCWGDQHIQEMIMRHRNNPCIIMWSTANELRNLNEKPEWATEELLRELYGAEFNPEPEFGIDTEVIRLAQRALQVDPYHVICQATDAFRGGVEATRETYGEQWINVGEYLESIGGVLGTQYSVVQTVKAIREWFPNLATCETEGLHLLTAKGSYYGAGELTVSRDYTAGRVGGGGYNNGEIALSPTREYGLKYIRDYGNINGGTFVWTGIDYMGEGIDPKIPNEPDMVATSHHGFVDFAGFPKDSYYLFQSQWTNKEDAPMAYIVPDDWNVWSDGDDVLVEVYTNCPKAELFLNGESLGVRKFAKKTTTFGIDYYETMEATADDATNTSDVNTGGYLSPNGEYGYLHLTWDVPYEAGNLKVVAYDEDGTALAEYEVDTYSAPKSIELEADKNAMKSDGDGMIYVTASIVDENGVLCRDADKDLKIVAEGAKIAGVSNGYQGEHEAWKYGGTQFSYYSEHSSHMGLMEIALQSEEAGEVTVKVYGDDLETGTLHLFTTEDDSKDVIGYQDVDIRIPVGAELELPEEINAVHSDGSVTSVNVKWPNIPDTGAAGEYEIVSDLGAKANIVVYEITAVEPVNLTVYGEAEAVLPKRVKVTYSDGLTGFEQVTWNGMEGMIEHSDCKVTANITYEESKDLLDASAFSIASTASFTSNSTRQIANVLDGDLASCWDNRVKNSTSLNYDIMVAGDTSLEDTYIEFTWEEYQTLNAMDLYFVIGETLPDVIEDAGYYSMNTMAPRIASLPGDIKVYYWDGMSWKAAANTEITFAEESLKATSLSFDTVTTDRIRIYMFNATPHTEDGTIQLAEIDAFAK